MCFHLTKSSDAAGEVCPFQKYCRKGCPCPYYECEKVESRQKLTPVFDFANHCPTPTCKLEGDAEGRLVLRAVRNIAIGEEVTIDYQVSDDAKLVATYGFSLIHHPQLECQNQQ